MAYKKATKQRPEALTSTS